MENPLGRANIHKFLSGLHELDHLQVCPQLFQGTLHPHIAHTLTFHLFYHQWT